MINFRYHIVSLMAVFIALSVGIAVGVSLSPSVDQGLLQQAAQDRKQVTDLRAELDRRKALDDYRNAYDEQVGADCHCGRTERAASRDGRHARSPGRAWCGPFRMLSLEPAAPSYAKSRSTPKPSTRQGRGCHRRAWPTTSARLGLNDTMSPATRLGVALGRSIGSKEMEDRDALAIAVGESLESRGLVTISKESAAQAQLIIVVTAPASDPRPTPEELTAHVQFQVGLTTRARRGPGRPEQRGHRGHRCAGGPVGSDCGR